MSRIQSSLAGMQAAHMDAEAVKRRGWGEHGILVVAVGDERLDWERREWVKQIGDLLYGKRANNGTTGGKIDATSNATGNGSSSGPGNATST